MLKDIYVEEWTSLALKAAKLQPFRSVWTKLPADQNLNTPYD
jgi:hypothetical protein